MKRCSRCGLEKSLDDFGSHRGERDGRARWCRPCQRQAKQLSRQKPEVRARATAYARARRQNPQVRVRQQQLDAARKLADPTWHRKYTWTDDARARARARRTDPKGREKRQAVSARRRARLLLADDGFTAIDWREVLDEFQHRCAYCLADAPLQIEHLQPLSRGGRHARSNVVPACRKCNQIKASSGLLQSLSRLMEVV